MERIPYGRQHITDEDIQEVVEVLKSNALTQGPQVPLFEKSFAKYVGSRYAVAVSNGTAALHLCTMSLNVKAGNKVITTPITFAASANCVRYCGGEVVFADIDPETFLLDINKVRKLLMDAPKGTYSGIIPVDFAGRAVNLEAFRQLADEYGLWIIEDSCHAPGGYFVDSKGVKQRCGNGKFADASIFSFHPVKHIAAGEGGMITTNDKELYLRLLNLRTHGIQQDYDKRIFDNSLWYYEMQELGFNYRLTDIQAALGKSQLSRAIEGLNKRIEIARRYEDAFKGSDIIISQKIEGHAYHLFVIRVHRRKELHQHLRELDIWAQVHYIPVHLMPYYRTRGWKEGDLPIAEEYYQNCLSLPMYPTLKEEEQDFVIKSILDYFN